MSAGETDRRVSELHRQNRYVKLIRKFSPANVYYA